MTNTARIHRSFSSNMRIRHFKCTFSNICATESMKNTTPFHWMASIHQTICSDGHNRFNDLSRNENPVWCDDEYS